MLAKKFNIFVYLIMIIMTLGCLVVGIYCALDTSFTAKGDITYAAVPAEYLKFLEQGYVFETADNFEYKDGAIYKYNGTNTKIIIPAIDGVYAIMGQDQTLPLSSNGGLNVSTYNAPISSSTYATTDGINTALVGVVITESYTTIGNGAFRSCSSLSEITILSEATSIGNYAFASCSSLTSITIPNSVISIGEYAFASCSKLTSISIPEKVTSIGDSAFYYCRGLTTITVPSSIKSIGEKAFYRCTNLNYTSVNNANYLTDAGGNATVLIAATDTSITSCTIAETTKVIYAEAFYRCEGLTSITIPESVVSIGMAAFRACDSLAEASLPEGITSIEDRVFEDCAVLTSITIPESVTSIGQNAFSGCMKLTSVIIPEAVISIGQNAFSDCTNLALVIVPSGLTRVGHHAFYNCANLAYTTIGRGRYLTDSEGELIVLIEPTFKTYNTFDVLDGTKVIYESAFENCTDLTSVTIPSSVTNIGDSAFKGCTSLTSITIEDATENNWAYCAVGETYETGTKIDLTDPSANKTYFVETYVSKIFLKKV